MGRKPNPNPEPRIRKSYDATPAAWENLCKLSTLMHMGVSQTLNHILERTAPKWIEKLEAEEGS